MGTPPPFPFVPQSYSLSRGHEKHILYQPPCIAARRKPQPPQPLRTTSPTASALWCSSARSTSPRCAGTPAGGYPSDPGRSCGSCPPVAWRLASLPKHLHTKIKATERSTPISKPLWYCHRLYYCTVRQQATCNYFSNASSKPLCFLPTVIFLCFNTPQREPKPSRNTGGPRVSPKDCTRRRYTAGRQLSTTCTALHCSVRRCRHQILL